MKKIHLAVSPCPNDTYIFYALLHKAIDLGPYQVTCSLADVQELNESAIRGEPDLVKISAATYPLIRDKYRLLRAGGAMGWGCGPIVVAKKKYDFQEVAQEEMAIPGRLTTANLLLTLHGVHCGQRIELRYDRILSSVASGEVGAGCLIHEGRFVYHTYGLHKILDLGKWWEQSQRLPLPLGVIVLHRRWDDDFVCWIEDTIRKSIEYSDKHTKQVWPFIKQCAQEMDDTTITEHISAYVNEYSYYLGQQGRKALETMLNLQELRELA